MDSRSWDVVRKSFFENNGINFSGGLRRRLEERAKALGGSVALGVLVKLAGGIGEGGWVLVGQRKSRSELITGES